MEKDKLIITIKLIFQHIENLPSLHDSCLLDALHESGHVAGLYSGRQIRNGIKVIMPWFKQGAHDRVFNSMLNGAVCVTDENDYMKEILVGDEDVIFYQLDQLQQLPQQIRSILEDRERWEEMQKKAYHVASGAHTWAHRAKFIHEEMLCKNF